MKPCTAYRCKNVMHNDEAFCKDHWNKLPKPMRDAIWSAFRRRNRNASLENISAAYKYLRDMEFGDFAFPEKAISVRQPWPHRMFYEGKDIENRTQRTHHRGYILIHAAKKTDEPEFCETMKTPMGGIVGVAKIVGCVTSSNSPWFRGPYGWVLEDCRPVEFIPCKGMQGFFKPDIDFNQLRFLEAL